MEYRYFVYGVTLTSDIPFDFPADAGAPSATRVSFARGNDEHFRDAAPEQEGDNGWFVYRELADGSVYFRWSGLYEFRVSPSGELVQHRPIGTTDPPVLQNFLFGQAVSFALVRQGLEPVHAAIVDVGGEAIALLGDCTYGKSTLAAAFLAQGCRLVSDDVLVVGREAARLLAQPGTGRIKLNPDSARALLPGREGTPVFRGAEKRAFQLDERLAQRKAVPLRAFLVLPPPAERAGCARIAIETIEPTRLFHALVKNTYVRYMTDPARLRRNFAHNTQLAGAVDAFALRYPPGIRRLPLVVTTVLEHVRARLQGDAA
jgi:hypothetical protein